MIFFILLLRTPTKGRASSLQSLIDVYKTEKFYNGILELEIAERSKTSISFLTKNSKLIFVKVEDKNPFYHFAFNIPNNQLNEALLWIQSKIEIIEIESNKPIAEFEDWNAMSFYFYDNNNNIVEFIARFDLENQSDQNFKSTSIQSVSEIGIVVENVSGESIAIANEHNLPRFSKQINRENFVALGDDNGLLLFVKDRRPWFPTQKVAEKYWTKIKMEINGKIIEFTV